jgi:hypothetical protein
MSEVLMKEPPMLIDDARQSAIAAIDNAYA